MLADSERHAEAEFLDSPIGPGHIVEFGDLDVQVLDAGADRVDWQAAHGRDGHGMMAFVDAEEADLQFHAADGFVDVVRQAGVEDGVVVAWILLGCVEVIATCPIPEAPVTNPSLLITSGGAGVR